MHLKELIKLVSSLSRALRYSNSVLNLTIIELNPSRMSCFYLTNVNKKSGKSFNSLKAYGCYLFSRSSDLKPRSILRKP